MRVIREDELKNREDRRGVERIGEERRGCERRNNLEFPYEVTPINSAS